jgi:hypothetical protein
MTNPTDSAENARARDALDDLLRDAFCAGSDWQRGNKPGRYEDALKPYLARLNAALAQPEPRHAELDSGAVREAEELRVLIDKATNEDLADDGRYFAESCDDLTRCRHEEIGEYQNTADGALIEWLWNRRRKILSLLAAQIDPSAREVR